MVLRANPHGNDRRNTSKVMLSICWYKYQNETKVRLYQPLRLLMLGYVS